MFQGVDEMPFTARPYFAGSGISKSSQPAEPEAPLETRGVWPCAAACSQTSAQNLFPAAPRDCSHNPYPVLRTEAASSSTARSAARFSPPCRLVDAAAYSSTVAAGATEPAISTSRYDSTASLV